jgi:hypothetical protein
VFLCETQEFVTVEEMIHSVDIISEQQPECAISLRLGSTDLN